jgi:hypothetical protein
MSRATILCSSCYTELPPSHCNTGHPVPCPACRVEIQATVFPAIFKGFGPGQTGERILVEGESSCFYHEQKKAVVPCDICGRFLCAICDVELDGKHLCPPCLEAGRQKGTLETLQTRRVLYDNAAFLLAVVPVVLSIILWVFTLVTAPMAVILGIISFYKPNSVLGFARFKALAAIVIGLLQVAAWVVVFVLFWDRIAEVLNS